MTRMTVRDVRLHWPEAEKALAQGEEIVVTRDAKPVARLLPFIPARPRARPRFDPASHMKRLRRLWKDQPAQLTTEESLALDRADRTG